MPELHGERAMLVLRFTTTWNRWFVSFLVFMLNAPGKNRAAILPFLTHFWEMRF